MKKAEDYLISEKTEWDVVPNHINKMYSKDTVIRKIKQAQYDAIKDTICFGNWLNQNAEIWGNDWVLNNGRSYTTEELYAKYKGL